MYIKPKKGLGQHFLVDKNIQRKIIANCAFGGSDIVLEIGAGRGELTGLIAHRVKKVYALEIDSYLCEVLKDNLSNYTNIEIINQDILKFDLRRYFKKPNQKIVVVGNIPYYITSPILERLLKFRAKIDTIFITVQKEFARRMTACAGSKDYGAFSCFVQYYAQPRALFFIKKTSFLPIPKVDSAFVRLKIRRFLPLNLKKERLFFKIIRAAFNKRRKTLRNSLQGTISSLKLEAFFNRYNLDTDIRPEKLTLEDFIHLTDI
jgi:16S rRNA (adenine1518-N6/adenine1519-N6)-dimethyltransferase